MLVFSVILAVLSASVYMVSVAGVHLTSNTDLKEISNEYLLKRKEVQSNRGAIYDRNNNIIAQDVNAYTLYAVITNTGNNDYVADKQKTAEALQPFLTGLSVEQILATLNTENLYQVYFGTPGKYLTLDQKNAIDALKIKGLGFDEIIRRNYPNGEFASHLIGVAQYDEETQLMQGSFGLEAMYNTELSGKNGYIQYQAATNGLQLPQIQVDKQDAVNGNNVTLTLDKSIQETLEKTMKGYVTDIGAEAVWGSVMEVDTGKVIAWGQTPSFDPNDMSSIQSYQNIGSQWSYEPGSTMKTFTYAAAIDSGHYNGKKTLVADKYYIGVDDNGKPYRAQSVSYDGLPPITNAGYVNYGTIDYDKGFVYSSNVAIADIMVSELPYSTWREYIDRFGFLKNVNTAEKLPEENTIIADQSIRDEISVGYGQGITVTMLQMLQAYSAIFSDGTMVKPYFVDKITNSKTGEALYTGKTTVVANPISASTAAQMQALMYRVANDSDGTAQRYLIDDVDIIAKTGTAQIVIDGTYSSDTFIYSVAVGMPANDPQVMIYYAFKAKSNYNMNTNADKVKELMRKVAVAYGMIDQKTGDDKTPVSEQTMGHFINQSVIDAKSAMNGVFTNVMYIGAGKQVLDQYPKAGSQVLSSARVFILTSKEELVVPDFTGYSYKDVQAFAELTGMQVNLVGTGFVQSQSIVKGSLYDGTAVVTITLK